MKTDILIRNGKIVLFDRLIVGDIQVQDGIIHAIGKAEKPVVGNIEIDASGKYIIPGFVDIHTHGNGGFDLTNGLFDKSSSTFKKDPASFREGLQRATRNYLAAGTTRTILATVSAPPEELLDSFKLLNAFLDDETETFRNVVGGILVEGTFIKNPDFAGAQNPKFFRKPSIELFQQLQVGARGRIRSVNVTPEFGEDARALIEYLTQNNVVAAAGHTGASADEYQRAVEKGLRVAIHFLNGPTGSSTKPFGSGGAIQAVLRSQEVFAELITDGYHVDPIYIREVLRRKGLIRTLAISDSMFITGLEDIDTFVVSGILGRVSANRRYLEVVGTQNTLFGSVLRMDQAFSNIISWLTTEMQGIWFEHHPALPFREALIQATWLCSRNPAKALRMLRPETRYLGQDLSAFTGSLEIGKSADLLVVSIDGEPGNYSLNVENVIFKGQLAK
jgi:N-acetylglucosamine-6-phosphate deacetylase